MSASEDPAADVFVCRVLDAYRRTPATTGHIRPADRRLARDLHARGVSVQTVDDAFLLASVRRFARPLPSGSPPTARSLAYFLPLVEELLATPIDDGYRRYLASVLQRTTSRPCSPR
jgi:hypothetical protein